MKPVYFWHGYSKNVSNAAVWKRLKGSLKCWRSLHWDGRFLEVNWGQLLSPTRVKKSLGEKAVLHGATHPIQSYTQFKVPDGSCQDASGGAAGGSSSAPLIWAAFSSTDTKTASLRCVSFSLWMKSLYWLRIQASAAPLRAWLTDRPRWYGGVSGWISALTAWHSFPCCHKSLPSPRKVRLRWLLADPQAPPARHGSFYQPRPRWLCGSAVLTPPLMRKEGRGGYIKGGRSL